MTAGSVVVLCGGVGGAKLVLGLQRILRADTLTVVVNTGDDFDHYGLRICPDLDTVTYTLAGISDAERGWGRAGESWHCLDALEQLGGETWFRLGDRDLAMHLMRTRHLAAGRPLSLFTREITRQLAVPAQVLPMTDQAVRTELSTDAGHLSFQDYFVRHQCGPAVRALHYAGAEGATPAPGVLEALANEELRAVLIAPSNPYLSIAPILAVPGIVEALSRVSAPVVAVTPIIGDSAVKGPTAKLMRELQLPPSALTIAGYYGSMLDGFVIDSRDSSLVDRVPVPCRSLDTLMVTIEDRERVAASVLDFSLELSDGKQNGREFSQ